MPEKKEKISSGVQAAPKLIKIPTGSHGSHSYNMFCSEYFKSGENPDNVIKHKGRIIYMHYKCYRPWLKYRVTLAAYNPEGWVCKPPPPQFKKISTFFRQKA